MKTIIKTESVITSDLQRPELGSDALTLKQGKRERAVYLKYYEVDAGPEEPRFEEYIGFYTNQESVTCELGDSQFIFLEHYKPEIVCLSKVRQEGRWQVDGQQDRREKVVELMLC